MATLNATISNTLDFSFVDESAGDISIVDSGKVGEAYSLLNGTGTGKINTLYHVDVTGIAAGTIVEYDMINLNQIQNLSLICHPTHLLEIYQDVTL